MSIISFAKDSTFTCFGTAASHVIKRDKLTNSRAFHDMTVNAIKGHGNALSRMHTIREFIPLAGFDAADLHVDKFFNGLKYGMWIMVNDGLLEWMGYPMDKKTNIESSRKRFGKLVTEFDSEKLLSFELTGSSSLIAMRESMISDNNLTLAETASVGDNEKSHRIDQCLLMPPTVDQINESYPIPYESNQSEQHRFRIIQPKLFHETVMSLPGDKGKRVRRYFTTVNELMIAYDLYQQVYQIIDAARVKCDLETMITKLQESVGHVSNKLDGANEKLTDMSEQLTEATDEVGDLSHQVGTLNINVDTLHDRLGTAAPDHIYPPQTPALTHIFMLYGDGKRGYKCIRVQHRNKSTAIARASRAGYHNHAITIPYAQGAINLWHEVRGSFRGATFVGTTCSLNAGTTEVDLVAAVNAADEQRRAI
jgi:hypothetical protein